MALANLIYSFALCSTPQSLHRAALEEVAGLEEAVILRLLFWYVRTKLWRLEQCGLWMCYLCSGV